MKNSANRNFIPLLIYFFLSYPLFYFAYKFGNPDFGNTDFYQYYFLYKDWEFSKVISPFNTRIISSFLIYLLNKTGLFYSTEINYHNSYIDQQVYFNAIFFNYICLVFTAFVVFKMINTFFKNMLFAFITGLLVFLGFGALFYSLNPLTDSFSYLLFSLIFFFYLLRNYLLLPLLLMAVFQREYIFFVMGLISLVDAIYYKNEKKYFLIVFFSSLFCFLLYYVLRKTLFYTPDFSNQLNFKNLFTTLFHPHFPGMSYLRQSLLNQNILILYGCIILYKIRKKISYNRVYLLISILLVAQSHFISLASNLGNNCGRYFYITLPVFLYYIAYEAYPLLSGYLKTEIEKT